MRWFRFYDDVINDPKVQNLSGDLFKLWVNFLCLASKNNGSIPPLNEVAFALRCDEASVTLASQDFLKRGLLDQKFGKLYPHNWNKRQFKSDTSTDRTKRYRDRHKNVTVTSQERPQITDTEQRQKQKDKPPVVPLGGEEQEAFEFFCSAASRSGLPVPSNFTPSRRKFLKARLVDCGGLEGWKVAMSKLEASDFCCGKVSDFKANFDFVLQAKSFTKLMEGNYDNRENNKPKAKPDYFDGIMNAARRAAKNMEGV